LRIRLYGRLGDLIATETEVDAPGGCTVAEIRQALMQAHPNASAALGRSRACAGDKLISDVQHVDPSDLIEFLPPVSGG
jgi:molybdopterin converting factor small subunit